MDTRVIVVDKEGTRFGSGPVEDASVSQITWELNGSGSASISFHPLARNANQIKILERELQIWFDDELMWWGVPWRASGDLNAVTVECEGLLSHFRRRIVDDASLIYTSIDQLQIAWNLLAFAQSEATQANRDFNIGSSFIASGHVRSREYKRDEHGIIYDLLQEFPTLDDGFDYEIQVDATNQRLWVPHYPKMGTTLNDLKLMIREDRNRGVQSMSWASDGTTHATHIYVTGGSSGDVKFEQNYEDVAASAQFGLSQVVISDGSQKDVTWLLAKATKETNERKNVAISPAITTVSAPKDYFRLVKVGDSIPVFVDYGFYQLDDTYRVGQVQWTPEGTVLTFVEEAA